MWGEEARERGLRGPKFTNGLLVARRLPLITLCVSVNGPPKLLGGYQLWTHKGIMRQISIEVLSSRFLSHPPGGQLCTGGPIIVSPLMLVCSDEWQRRPHLEWKCMFKNLYRKLLYVRDHEALYLGLGRPRCRQVCWPVNSVNWRAWSTSQMRSSCLESDKGWDWKWTSTRTFLGLNSGAKIAAAV